MMAVVLSPPRRASRAQRSAGKLRLLCFVPGPLPSHTGSYYRCAVGYVKAFLGGNGRPSAGPAEGQPPAAEGRSSKGEGRRNGNGNGDGDGRRLTTDDGRRETGGPAEGRRSKERQRLNDRRRGLAAEKLGARAITAETVTHVLNRKCYLCPEPIPGIFLPHTSLPAGGCPVPAKLLAPLTLPRRVRSIERLSGAQGRHPTPGLWQSWEKRHHA